MRSFELSTTELKNRGEIWYCVEAGLEKGNFILFEWNVELLNCRHEILAFSAITAFFKEINQRLDGFESPLKKFVCIVRVNYGFSEPMLPLSRKIHKSSLNRKFSTRRFSYLFYK